MPMFQLLSNDLCFLCVQHVRIAQRTLERAEGHPRPELVLKLPHPMEYRSIACLRETAYVTAFPAHHTFSFAQGAECAICELTQLLCKLNASDAGNILKGRQEGRILLLNELQQGCAQSWSACLLVSLRARKEQRNVLLKQFTLWVCAKLGFRPVVQKQLDPIARSACVCILMSWLSEALRWTMLTWIAVKPALCAR